MNFKILIINVLIMCSCTNQGSKQTQIALKDMSPEFCLLLPVSIEDTTLYFLWDTGASNTDINKDVADILNLQMTDTTYVIDIYQLHNQVSKRQTKGVELKFGDMQITAPLLVHDRLDSVNRNGIIGQDIISKYYWLFDLMNQHVVISQTPCMPNQEDYIESFNINFTDGKINIPYCNVRLNDTITIPVAFDTGMSGVAGTKELGYDLFIMAKDSTDSVSLFFKSLLKPNRIEIGISNIFPNTVTKGLLVDSIKVHDKVLRKILMLYDVNDYYKESICFISAHFMKRFSVFYYDPFQKQISMFRRESDTTVNDKPRAYDYIRSALGYKK